MTNPVPDSALHRQALVDLVPLEVENEQRRDARDRTSRCWGIVFMGVGIALTTATVGLTLLAPTQIAQSSKEIVGACFIGGIALGTAITVSGFSKFMFGHYCCRRSTVPLRDDDVGMTA